MLNLLQVSQFCQLPMSTFSGLLSHGQTLRLPSGAAEFGTGHGGAVRQVEPWKTWPWECLMKRYERRNLIAEHGFLKCCDLGAKKDSLLPGLSCAGLRAAARRSAGDLAQLLGQETTRRWTKQQPTDQFSLTDVDTHLHVVSYYDVVWNVHTVYLCNGICTSADDMGCRPLSFSSLSFFGTARFLTGSRLPPHRLHHHDVETLRAALAIDGPWETSGGRVWRGQPGGHVLLELPGRADETHWPHPGGAGGFF